ncbi:phosphoglycerate mutase-like protein [Crucibulum laeve]|uniref:Phosphoglycerate mutase-like protein n=1 Tax=Crucibulum laeve TaxID=68775 RepID=A0A5C3MCI9_9AGAR|nr:phosphoglycerate mutase-like protein [Crucibulum laeve]
MAVIAKIYLIRHGETDANRNNIIQGQLDTPLNEAGEKQARLVGEALREVPFDLAFSSDLSRAAKTADAILAHHAEVKLQKQEELRERYMGSLQGSSMAPGARMVSAVDETVENGSEFVKRGVRWWNRRIVDYARSLPPRETPYNILVVSHGGFIGTLTRNLIESRKVKCAKDVVIWKCFNTSISIIELGENGKGTLLQYGGIAHLEDKAVESNADEVDVSK